MDLELIIFRLFNSQVKYIIELMMEFKKSRLSNGSYIYVKLKLEYININTRYIPSEIITNSKDLISIKILLYH